MLDYFRNCSSNPHQDCCEDSLTKGLYLFSVRCPFSILTQGLNCISNLTNVNLTCTIIAISRTVFKRWPIQTWHGGRLMHGISASMPLTLTWGHIVGRQRQRFSVESVISTTKRATTTSIKLATTVGLFFLTWPWLWKRFMDWPPCFFLPVFSSFLSLSLSRLMHLITTFFQ